MKDWYKRPLTEVLEDLTCDPTTGLDQEEADRRLQEYGPNELIERGIKRPWQILLDQFKETMVVVLIIATIISLFLGEIKDGVVILIIVVLNALLGFRQEYQAEQAMAALKKLAVPKVRVRRGSHIKEISARLLVPGDVVLLEAGNLVAADCRLLESQNLRTQEAALTGESEPVAKDANYLPDRDHQNHGEVPLAERYNMVYMGTVVSYGRGQAIVVATGMQTELGEIAELMQASTSEPTPLQRRLDQLGKGLALAAIVLVGIVFGLGLLRGEDIKILFLTAIGMAVAAVPEGLPAVVTISLALGARRMLKRRALIRKLPAVEALGSVTVICSDKTGTLTENRMTVTVLDVADNRIDLSEQEINIPIKGSSILCIDSTPDEAQQKALRSMPALTLLLAGGALCNDALLECDDEIDGFNVVGDPTEGALLLASIKMGLAKDELGKIFPRIAEIPFDSERKLMTTVHRMPSSAESVPEEFHPVWDWQGWAGIDQVELVSFTKGAIDNLLRISNRVWVENRVEELNSQWQTRIEFANERLAKQGMRVLGVACCALDQLPAMEVSEQNIDKSPEDKIKEIEQDLIFVGLVGMIDPARPEVKQAVSTCRSAGIRPMMITGDHPLTAGYIANELGILGESSVQTGHDLDRLSAEDLSETILESTVYARVSPSHKLKIVEVLQGKGEIVAMTGDGVNDSPALKKADIGVAMGITGTDVAKEAADIVLLDDNFSTIVAAVREGRIIYDNIRRFIQYTLTSNAGEIWVMLLAPFLGMPLPLVPIQILWINLVTDGLPGLALSVEPGERNTMERGPYPPNENVFARGLASNVIWIGLLMGLLSLGAGFVYWLNRSIHWQTMVFTTLTLSEMGYVMAIRSNRDSLFRIGLFTNRALLGAVILTTMLQLAVVYIPFLQGIFNTTTLPLNDLFTCVILSSGLFVAVEIQKWFRRRKIDLSLGLN